MCSDLKLPNILTRAVSKQEIEQGCREANRLELIEEMSKLSKVKHLVGEDYERKEYLGNRDIFQVRTKFSERCAMFYCKMNYRNDPVFKEECWMCDSCQSAIDDMAHVMICAAYQPLRVDKNMDSDSDNYRVSSRGGKDTVKTGSTEIDIDMDLKYSDRE